MGEKTIVRGAPGEVGRGRQMGVPKLDTFLNTSFSTFFHQKIQRYVAFEITLPMGFIKTQIRRFLVHS